MKDKINELKELSSLLEPDSNDREFFISKIIKYTENFLTNINEIPVYRTTIDNGSGIYNSPISENPTSIDDLLKILKVNVDTPGINPASHGHLGFIPGGGVFYSALGDYIADITNRYAGVFFASPGAVRMENMLTDWMSELIGFPKSSGGNLTSGGSIANLIGIVTARDSLKLKAEDFKRSVIYLSEHIHHSVDKAIRIAGLKECPRRYISLDENYKIRADELEQVIRTDKASGLLPWLIIASAGTTDVGAIDPLDELGNIAKKFNCWFHVDAAYGGFFILTDRGKNKLIGLDKSDSVVMDPHKGLFLPYGTGAVLVKNKHNLYESHYYNANYMQDASLNNEELAPADLSPELSKHFRGLRLWFPLKLAGVSAFKNALEEKLLLAQYFYEQLKEIKGFEVGPYPDLSVVTYRYIPKTGNADEFNKKLIREIQEEGKVFISSTILNGKFTLRAAILSFRTHLDTVDLLADILKHKVKGF